MTISLMPYIAAIFGVVVLVLAWREADKWRDEAAEFRRTAWVWKSTYHAEAGVSSALRQKLSNERRWHKETIGDLRAVCERRDALERDAVGLLANYQNAQTNYLLAVDLNRQLSDALARAAGEVTQVKKPDDPNNCWVCGLPRDECLARLPTPL